MISKIKDLVGLLEYTGDELLALSDGDNVKSIRLSDLVDYVTDHGDTVYYPLKQGQDLKANVDSINGTLAHLQDKFAEYLPKAGGTLTGQLLIETTNDRPLFVTTNEANKWSLISFGKDGSPYFGWKKEENVLYSNLQLAIGNISNIVWHKGNMGHTSGLDADTVDGIHGIGVIPNGADPSVDDFDSYLKNYAKYLIVNGTTEGVGSIPPTSVVLNIYGDSVSRIFRLMGRRSTVGDGALYFQTTNDECTEWAGVKQIAFIDSKVKAAYSADTVNGYSPYGRYADGAEDGTTYDDWLQNYAKFNFVSGPSKHIGDMVVDQAIILNAYANDRNRFFRLMANRSDSSLYFQTSNNTADDWGPVKKVAFTDSKVASAVNADTINGFQSSNLITGNRNVIDANGIVRIGLISHTTSIVSISGSRHDAKATLMIKGYASGGTSIRINCYWLDNEGDYTCYINGESEDGAIYIVSKIDQSSSVSVFDLLTRTELTSVSAVPDDATESTVPGTMVTTNSVQTITGKKTFFNSARDVLDISTTSLEAGIRFITGDTSKAWVGYNQGNGAYLYNNVCGKYLGIDDNGVAKAAGNEIIHLGNLSKYSFIHADPDDIDFNSFDDYCNKNGAYSVKPDSNQKNLPFRDYGGLLQFNSAESNIQIAFQQGGAMWARNRWWSKNNSSTEAAEWRDWKQVAFTSSQVESARNIAAYNGMTDANSMFKDGYAVLWKGIQKTSDGIAGANGFPATNNANSILWINDHGKDTSGDYGYQLGHNAGSVNGNNPLYFRSIVGGKWNKWQPLAFADEVLPLTGGNITGKLSFNNVLSLGYVDGNLSFGNTDTADLNTIVRGGTVWLQNTVSSPDLVVKRNNVGIGTANPIYKLDVTGNVSISGAIIVGNDRYIDNPNVNARFGINCNNSDIIGLNGLYFNDVSENWHEGLNFIHAENDSLPWYGRSYDSFYAAGGNFYFTVENGSKTTATLDANGNLTIPGKLIAQGGVQQTSMQSFSLLGNPSDESNSDIATYSADSDSQLSSSMSIVAGRQYYNDQPGKVISDYRDFGPFNAESRILSTEKITFEGDHVIVDDYDDGDYFVYILRYLQVSEKSYVILVNVDVHHGTITPKEIEDKNETEEGKHNGLVEVTV